MDFLVVAACVTAVVYGYRLARYPHARCLWCNGRGRFLPSWSPFAAPWGRCRRCKGTGQRRRFPVWLWSHIHPR